MLTTLVALLLAAVPFSKWLDMRLAAGALRDADLTQAITATDIADYQKRLAAAREATGASAATIATLTIQVAGELSKESDRKVMCLSVLDAAASITQTSAGSDTPPDLVDHFAVVKDRLHEMYRKQGHPAGSDASGPDQYAHCASDAARR